MNTLGQQLVKAEKPLKLVNKLTAAFSARKIAFCHFKSNVRLSSTISGMADLDILVDRSQSAAVRQVLAELDFKPFASPSWRSYPGISDWLGLDRTTGTIIHLHLHFQIVTGARFVKQYCLDIDTLVLASSRPDPQTALPVPDPCLELILFAIREELRKSHLETFLKWMIRVKVKKAVREEYEYLRGQANCDGVMKYAEEVFGSLHAKPVAATVLNANPTCREVRALGRIIRRRFSRCKRLSAWRSSLAHGSGYLAHILRGHGLACHDHWRGKRSVSGGLTVAIVGCDGSGKTTLEEQLLNSLKRQIDVRSYYMGSGDGNLPLALRLAKWIWWFISGLRPDKAAKQPAGETIATIHARRDTHYHALGRTLFALRLAANRLHLIRRATRVRNNGVIGLFVRFPQLQVSGMNDGPRLDGMKTVWGKAAARRERSLLKRACDIGVDLVLLLDVPLRAAVERRPGVAADRLEQKRSSLLEVHWGRATVIRIDASQPLEDVRKHALTAIWRQL